MPKACIVCAAAANVYCHNDDAYLCFECDHTVHSAHALAQTHRRTPIGEHTGAEEDLDEGVVPQQLVPMNKAQGMDELDLSFSDDAWFAVPDTACSTARGGVKSTKDKGFDMDLFGFDAALDEEVAFGLEAELSGFDEFLVPEIEPPVTQPPSKVSMKQECEESLPAPVAEPYRLPRTEAAPAGPAPTVPAPAASQSAPISCTYPPESVATVDNYIPHSLLPFDFADRNAALAERREKVQRFREKKKNRQFKKLIRYASRKRYAEVRPRIKGRFARKDEIAAAKAAGIPLEC